jgi:chemotaxis protein CheD
VGKVGEKLKATLGSCVGIAFLWKEKKIYGLAHCLLPDANITSFSVSAKYVSQAIPSLIHLMKIPKESFSEIEVHLAGGANMLVQLSKSNPEHIGKLNQKMAIKLLAENGFKVKHKDFGGEEGRQIAVDCSTEEVVIKKISKQR